MIKTLPDQIQIVNEIRIAAVAPFGLQREVAGGGLTDPIWSGSRLANL